MNSIGNACFAPSESRGADTGSTFLQSLLSTSPWREVEAYLTGQQILPATTYRLTLEYSLEGFSAIRLVPYCKRTIRALRPLPLPDGFDYSYKYADRRFFEQMKAELADDEEPLFVRPDGTITDTSFTNVLIETESGYLTPTRPLLKGTQREAPAANRAYRRSRRPYPQHAPLQGEGHPPHQRTPSSRGSSPPPPRSSPRLIFYPQKSSPLSTQIRL